MSGQDQFSAIASPWPALPLALESAVLENEQLRLTIYPSLGAKIGSIRTRPGDHELLQQPLLPYAPRDRTMAFEDGDASGYDECIPSVSGCELDMPGGTLSIPDHGDFWRLAFDVTDADAAHVAMSATGFSLPLHLQKTIALEGNRIILSYKLTNTGAGVVQYLWSAHPGFAVEPGDRIELPSSVESVMVQGSAGGRLGAEGARHAWPLTTTNSDDATDLSLVGSGEEPVGDKLFALAPPEGRCALRRARIGRRIEMRFDPRHAPYLGLWICYNGWPESKTAKQFCVALEPCTAPADSLAAAMIQGLGKRLDPNASDEWQVELRIT